MLATITKQYIVTTLGELKPNTDSDEQTCIRLHRAPYFIRMRSAEPQILKERLQIEMDDQIKHWKPHLKPTSLSSMNVYLTTEFGDILASHDGFEFRIWPHRAPQLFVPECVGGDCE
jgi:hypothetical protein